jgi:hypothetical protein
VDVAGNFPDECLHVLLILKEVYTNDALAKDQGLSPEQRLHFHQKNSGPKMDALKAWLTAQLEERKVEPNSGLGEAITYMLKYWEELTLFLHQAGAPLDNNVCEQALKKAILHRKNAYFYKTEKGARVGDLFMSLIHTCELNGVNPFDYLTALQKHVDEVCAHPADWMPWNYRDTLLKQTVPSRNSWFLAPRAHSRHHKFKDFSGLPEGHVVSSTAGSWKPSAPWENPDLIGALLRMYERYKTIYSLKI